MEFLMRMFTPPKPKTPNVPTPPTPTPEKAAGPSAEEIRRRKKRIGENTTIGTTALGLQDQASIATKTLLGQ